MVPEEIKPYENKPDAAIEAAKANGHGIVLPSPNTLLLDLDTSESLDRYEALRDTFFERFKLQEKSRWQSGSGIGWHVVVEMEESTGSYFIVAMQAILGSDPVREILSLERIENNVDPYGFLIKPKGAKEIK